LRAGEIVAIAGVSGNGQVALADVLCGTRAIASGSLRLRDEPLRANPVWLVHRGVARIPEDRSGVGVIGDLTVWENAVSERLRSPAFSRRAWVRRAAARRHAEHVLKTFDVRGGGPLAPARALSAATCRS
jgi:simple sugar transport system ATP-binding protein